MIEINMKKQKEIDKLVKGLEAYQVKDIEETIEITELELIDKKWVKKQGGKIWQISQ